MQNNNKTLKLYLIYLIWSLKHREAHVNTEMFKSLIICYGSLFLKVYTHLRVMLLNLRVCSQGNQWKQKASLEDSHHAVGNI